MPRSGINGTFTLPPNTDNQQPNTPISSAMFNAFADDVEQTYNTPQPIAYGGTGATTAGGAADALSPAFVNVASATTTNIGAATSPNVNITGTTTITAFDTAPSGVRRHVTFLGALTLTHNATSLILQGGANIPTAAGDTAEIVSLGSGNWKVEDYSKYSGQPVTLQNLNLSASVAANALTITLSSPASLTFRSASPANGTTSTLDVSSNLSLVISSGSTLGTSNGVSARIWVVAFNDAGTLRLGAINCRSGLNIFPLRDGIFSSTAEGGAGGADSAQVIYTGTAVTSKALTVLGYVEITQATAGTWATAPSLVQALSSRTKLPGDLVQNSATQSGAYASGTTLTPFDDTIPQIGEGTEFLTASVTPSAGCNLLKIEHSATYASNVANNITAALFRDLGADALSANGQVFSAAGNTITLGLAHIVLAGAVSATTFKIRAGGSQAGAVYINGRSSGAVYGGVAGAFLSVSELMS